MLLKENIDNLEKLLKDLDIKNLVNYDGKKRIINQKKN